MVNIIKKKRDGQKLNRDEITSIITGFVSGEVPDYQISAFLMAVYFKGMDAEETAILTDVMMNSGDLIDLSNIPGIKVDKHSTGGVGDKTTIVLAPLVAAAGVPVAKMSGRGLGFTGGTLDKLESIPGFTVDLSKEEFIEKIRDHNIAICGQNETLVPADKKIYALRDVTGTVDNMSLISSSVMCKKLACGADAILIDIKVGEGAYMKTEGEARKLARLIIDIGSEMNRDVRAVISSMEEPLGFAVGNAIEVIEAVETLKGNGPKDLTTLCIELGSQMLLLGKICKTKEEAEAKLKELINSGAALKKFKEFVQSQGGNADFIDSPELLPQASYSTIFYSKNEGYIQSLNAMNVGVATVKLGAGRLTKTSKIDHAAGILLKKKVGDYVKKEEALAVLFSNDQRKIQEATEILSLAYQIKPEKSVQKPLIIATIV